MFQSIAVSKKFVRMLKQNQSNTTKTFSSFDKEINKMNNSLFFFDLFSKQKDTVLYETYKTSDLAGRQQIYNKLHYKIATKPCTFTDNELTDLLQTRWDARLNQNYTVADSIYQTLLEGNVKIQDSGCSKGTFLPNQWRCINSGRRGMTDPEQGFHTDPTITKPSIESLEAPESFDTYRAGRFIHNDARTELEVNIAAAKQRLKELQKQKAQEEKQQDPNFNTFNTLKERPEHTIHTEKNEGNATTLVHLDLESLVHRMVHHSGQKEYENYFMDWQTMESNEYKIAGEQLKEVLKSKNVKSGGNLGAKAERWSIVRHLSDADITKNFRPTKKSIKDRNNNKGKKKTFAKFCQSLPTPTTADEKKLFLATVDANTQAMWNNTTTNDAWRMFHDVLEVQELAGEKNTKQGGWGRMPSAITPMQMCLKACYNS